MRHSTAHLLNQSFHSPSASESLSLAWPRERTTALQEQRERRSRPAGRRAGARSKEKATPMQRSPGILPCDCAQRLRGSLTAPPCAGSQLARILASHPAGLFSATAPLHRGPGHCASCAAKTKQIPARSGFGFGFGFALRIGAQDARYRGPVSGGGRAQERPAGWARGIAPSSLPAHGGAVSEPPEPCRAVAGQDARRPPLWGALSFGYFSLSTQRKVTRSPKASESLLATMRREAT